MDGLMEANNHPLKRRARLEFEGPNYFWLTWKIRNNHCDGLHIFPITIFYKPSIQWEELKQSQREAGGSVMLNGCMGDTRKLSRNHRRWGGIQGRNSGLSYKDRV